MRFVERQGLRLAYDVVGDGFPVLLHTGAAGDSRMWRDAGYTDGLLGEFRVVLLDHRGHGQSDAPSDPGGYSAAALAGDAIAVADVLGIDRFAFWGYSDGWRVGVELAASARERIAALVALGSVEGPDEEPGTWLAAAELVRMQGIRAILENEAAPDWLMSQLAETDREVVAREVECFGSWSPWPLFPRIEAPTLIIAGERESEGHEAAAAAAIRDARLVLLPDLGHLGTFVESALVLARVAPFLREMAARPA